ncbi:hypothetical protein PMEGAS228_30990 [Priestia megaterium]
MIRPFRPLWTVLKAVIILIIMLTRRTEPFNKKNIFFKAAMYISHFLHSYYFVHYFLNVVKTKA